MRTRDTDGLRSLERLQQMAREQRAAVAADDAATLCRIATLIPRVMEQLTRYPPTVTPEVVATVKEIQEAHGELEAYLQDRMAELSVRMRHCADGRQALRAYCAGAARTRVRYDMAQ